MRTKSGHEGSAYRAGKSMARRRNSALSGNKDAPIQTLNSHIWQSVFPHPSGTDGKMPQPREGDIFGPWDSVPKGLVQWEPGAGNIKTSTRLCEECQILQ